MTWLKHLETIDAAGVTTLGYDAAGRRVACAKSGTAFEQSDSVNYGYNARSELTSATAAVDSDYRYGYNFDDIGNRKTSSERGTNSVYTASQLNQYTAVDDFTPTYDADGNETVVKTATGIWQITYNGENRPVRWELVSSNSNTPNSNTQTLLRMSFDRMGRRVTKNDQRFVYDGYLQIANFHSPTPTQNSNYYIWDPTEPVATRPLVWQRSALGTQHSTLFYTHDGNKNVGEVIASDGSLAAHYEYAPFGALTVFRGASAADNPWRFSSEYAEDDTATVYYNYRHYEPVAGRWMSRDGLGEMGGLGLYIFVGNCTSYFDLLGLDGLALNAPTRIESPQEDQPKDNPQRVLELGGSSAIRVVDIYMTLGITDPVVSYELTCVCTNSKYHIVGSVDLTTEIRYMKEGAEVRDLKGNLLGKRTPEGVDRTLEHERFHAVFFEDMYNQHIKGLEQYKDKLYRTMYDCDKDRLKIERGLYKLQRKMWRSMGEYNHTSKRWKDWLEKNGGGML